LRTVEYNSILALCGIRTLQEEGVPPPYTMRDIQMAEVRHGLGSQVWYVRDVDLKFLEGKGLIEVEGSGWEDTKVWPTVEI